MFVLINIDCDCWACRSHGPHRSWRLLTGLMLKKRAAIEAPPPSCP